MRFGSAGDPLRGYISQPPKCGPETSHRERLPSEDSTNAPFRVPTSNRTPLIASLQNRCALSCLLSYGSNGDLSSRQARSSERHHRPEPALPDIEGEPYEDSEQDMEVERVADAPMGAHRTPVIPRGEKRAR